jgi:hypothetical protein
MGEGVPPQPWRGRPLSHRKRDRVRGYSPQFMANPANL